LGSRGFRGICGGIEPRLFRLRLSVTKMGELIAERHHYCREFRSINDFILQNWGACVDTVFGHVPEIGRVWIGKKKAIMIGLQEGCR